MAGFGGGDTPRLNSDPKQDSFLKLSSHKDWFGCHEVPGATLHVQSPVKDRTNIIVLKKSEMMILNTVR